MTLEREMATYAREKDRLIAEGHEGRYVLISGDQVLGLFDTRRDAVEAGYSRIGVAPFLAHQISRVEPVHRASYAAVA